MTPTCPACGAKFSHDKDLLRCRSCLLPDAVAAQGPEAIKAWYDQTLENKRLFGRMQARQLRGNREPRKQVTAGAATWLKDAKRKRKEARQHA